ncbi:tRNA pseudouridine synthase-like 1 [Argonauta hians]
MGRFLIFTSYLGTKYSGFQKQIAIEGKKVLTVQGQLEVALKSLNPLNEVKTCISSRTDAGVHAFENTLHCDLFRKNTECEYDPEFVKNGMNYWLRKRDDTIRVNKVLRVSDDFHCRRMMKRRSYMYRIGFPWKSIKPHHGYSALSILEKNQAHITWKPFDVKKLMEAAEVMTGTHDFTSFTTIKSLREKNDCPVREVSINVKLGKTAIRQHNPGLEFWEIHIYSRSFLFRQIRRMVGAMVQVAQDELSLDAVRHKLLDPPMDKTDGSIKSLPAAGLYLSTVNYDPKDLIYQPTVQRNKLESDTSSVDEEDESDISSVDEEDDLNESYEKI